VINFGGISSSGAEGKTEQTNVVYCLRNDDISERIPICVELDEGAKGVMGSWIDRAAVVKFGLKRKPCSVKARFTFRLFPGQTFCPEEEVELRLVFEPAGVRVQLKCLVLPESNTMLERSSVIIGDADIKYYGIRDLIEAKSPVFRPAVQAREVLESLGEQFAEQDMLDTLFGNFVDAGELDQWDPQLCVSNFPVGSVGRERVLSVLKAFAGDIIVTSLDGSKAELPPLLVQLKPGKLFEGVRARRYSCVAVPANLRSEIIELIAECMLCKKARAKEESPVLLPHALHGGRFFKRVQMDFLEGLKEAERGLFLTLLFTS